MRKQKRKAKASPSDSDNEDQSNEKEETDSEVPEGINDLMNLPIGLLRKELISRKYQPTVINNLPHWQLSAILRESTSSDSDSFFYKIMGYRTYWEKESESKPAFSKKDIDKYNQNGEDDENDEVDEEEEDSGIDDVNADELKKSRGRRGMSSLKEEVQDQLDPSKYKQKYVNGQFKYFPRTLISDQMPKKDVPPEYQPPQVIQPTETPEIPTKEPKVDQNESKQNEIDDDPNLIPRFVNTKLLDNGVLQSSIDELSPEQVKKIREEIKSNDFDVQSLIEEYNLKIAQRRIIEDSQFTDTQTQIVDDESENSNSDSDSDSSSSSSSSNSDNSDSEKENDEDEDDHRNDIF